MSPALAKHPLLLVIALSAMSPDADCATLLVDAFVEGPSQLGDGSPLTSIDQITSEVASERQIRVITGTGGIAGGVATFTMFSSRGDPDPNAALLLRYRPLGSDWWSLLPSDSFLVAVSSIEGEADLVMTFNEGNLWDHPTQGSARLRITEPGIYEYPLSGIGTGFTDFDYMINLRFVPQTSEFSLGVSEIRFIPEPSVGMLLTIAGIALTLRRRSSVESKRQNKPQHDNRLTRSESDFHSD